MSELTEIVNVLEARGHRVTPARLAVLAQAYRAPDQFAVEDLLRAVPQVGRATIFRTLRLLVDEEVLCRVLREDGRLLYRWSRRGHHHHLVCRSCGAVRDLSRCGVPGLLAEAVEAAGFAMDGHWLEVYGRCERCRGTGGTPA